ncbi:1642_t:CDS:1, partial [Acaulospora colombiana]
MAHLQSALDRAHNSPLDILIRSLSEEMAHALFAVRRLWKSLHYHDYELNLMDFQDADKILFQVPFENENMERFTLNGRSAKTVARNIAVWLQAAKPHELHIQLSNIGYYLVNGWNELW